VPCGKCGKLIHQKCGKPSKEGFSSKVKRNNVESVEKIC
jgi:hypothetical protein